MGPGAESQERSAIEEAVRSDPDVVFAVAFGSRVWGESTMASDFDLAVKFADGLSERERFEKHCFLYGDLQHENRRFVDVSDIESLPLEVAHDAVHCDFLCGDRQAFERFKTEIETEFDERCETLRREQRAVIDRIAEDGLRG